MLKCVKYPDSKSVFPFPSAGILLAACWLIRDGHFNESCIKKRPEYLVPELGAVRAPFNFHQVGNRLFFQTVMEYLDLMPTWCRLPG